MSKLRTANRAAGVSVPIELEIIQHANTQVGADTIRIDPVHFQQCEFGLVHRLNDRSQKQMTTIVTCNNDCAVRLVILK